MRSRGLIQMGLLLLIATPVACIAFSMLLSLCCFLDFCFLHQHDDTYVTVTFIKLTVLIYSLFGGTV